MGDAGVQQQQHVPRLCQGGQDHGGEHPSEPLQLPLRQGGSADRQVLCRGQRGRLSGEGAQVFLGKLILN